MKFKTDLYRDMVLVQVNTLPVMRMVTERTEGSDNRWQKEVNESVCMMQRN